jgi:phosphoglucomutase
MPVNIRRALLIIVLLAASGSWQLSSNAQGVTEAERLLQKAILLETVDGNLQAAIDQYKKVVAESGWFAARPSGTEDIYKIYAESFRGPDHLRRVLAEAQTIVGAALAAPTQQTEIASGKKVKEAP